MAGAGVDGQSCRFIDDGDVVIREGYLELDWRRYRQAALRWGPVEVYGIAGAQACGRPRGGRSVDLRPAVLDPGLDVATRRRLEIAGGLGGKFSGQEGVEAGRGLIAIVFVIEVKKRHGR